MKKKLLYILFLVSTLCNGQTKIDWNAIDIAKDTSARLSVFSTEKMYPGIYSPEEYGLIMMRRDSLLMTLKPAEAVIYNLYYPTQYTQNCFPVTVPDSTKKYIYGRFSTLYSEMTYSAEQRNWVAEHHKIISSKLNVYLINKELSPQMIFLILENNLYECFPSLINAYKRQTGIPDHFLVSVLYTMIDEHEFPKKTLTVTYNHFKTKDEYNQKQLANAYIVNEIIKLAEEYYIFKMQQE